MTLADTKQTAAARAASPDPRAAGRVAEVRAGGIDFPTAVVFELELNGYAIERVHDDERMIGVRLLKPGPPSTRRTPPPAAALAAPIASRRTARDPGEWPTLLAHQIGRLSAAPTDPRPSIHSRTVGIDHRLISA